MRSFSGTEGYTGDGGPGEWSGFKRLIRSGLGQGNAGKGKGISPRTGCVEGRAPHRGLRLPLWDQHRGCGGCPSGEGIRRGVGQRRLRGGEPLHLLPGHPGENQKGGGGIQFKPSGGGLLLSPYP